MSYWIVMMATSHLHWVAMNIMISVTKRFVTRMAALYKPPQDTEAGPPTIRLTRDSRMTPAVEAWRIPAYRRRSVLPR